MHQRSWRETAALPITQRIAAMQQPERRAALLAEAVDLSDERARFMLRLHQLLLHPATMISLGDGGAHGGYVTNAGLPTFMLTHWTRDRSRGPTRLPGHPRRRAAGVRER